jgi:uncharacterized protein YdbL (DUF1318 family)
MTQALSVVQDTVDGPPKDIVMIKAILSKIDMQRNQERDRVGRVDAYLRGEQDLPYLPANATVEFRQLRHRAKLNLLPLIVGSSTAAMKISGYRTPGAKSDSPTWDLWKKCGMVSKSAKLVESALANGYSFASVMRGTSVVGGASTSVPQVRVYSARQAFAAYADITNDIYPQYVVLTNTSMTSVIGFVDDECIYELGKDADQQLSIRSFQYHDMGCCPFVRIAPGEDIEGRCVGEVAPHIGQQDRLTQSVMDMLIVSNYGAHRIVMVSGIEAAKDKVTGKPIPITVSSKRIITTPAADAKLQTAVGTQLDGYLKIIDQAAAHMAIASRTPAQALAADLTNIGEGTLTASAQTFTGKIDDYKTTSGEQFKALFDLITFAVDGAEDETAEVLWADIGNRSLAQVADPLVKIAQGLAFPPQVLWSMIPGITQDQIEEAKRLMLDSDPIQALKAAGFAVRDSLTAISKSDQQGGWVPGAVTGPGSGGPP